MWSRELPAASTASGTSWQVTAEDGVAGAQDTLFLSRPPPCGQASSGMASELLPMFAEGSRGARPLYICYCHSQNLVLSGR